MHSPVERYPELAHKVVGPEACHCASTRIEAGLLQFRSLLLESQLAWRSSVCLGIHDSGFFHLASNLRH